VTLRDGKQHNAYQIAALCLLLVVLSLQLFFSVRRESQTWDEANHIFAGYRSWTHADFGLNPEHPLISASNLSGVEFGPGTLDPYGQFKLLEPTAVIDRGVFVFDGKFDLPLAAALSKVQKAQNLAQAKQLDQALQEAQAAVALSPDSIHTQLALGDILREMGQAQQACASYERALQLAKTIEPEFQIRSIPAIEEKLQSPGQ
jgi:tetratricopeptide (TPR) repeat protein